MTRKDRNQIKKVESVVTEKVGNYEKHPFFVKKKAAANAYLKDAGLPKKFLSKVTK